MKRTKIFWTEDERELVAIRLRSIFAENINTSNVTAIKDAQLVLPKDRRRPAGSQLAWRLREFVEEARRSVRIEGSLSKPQEDPGEVVFKSMILDLLAESIAQRVLKGLNNGTC